MKNFIKKIFYIFGFDIKKINKKQSSFDDLLKHLTPCEIPVIFDIGANNGQSIERFLNLFPQAIIHAFEPIQLEYNELLEKYSSNKRLHLNNIALGEIDGEKKFNINLSSQISSFNELNPSGYLSKKFMNQFGVNNANDLVREELVKVQTLDAYILRNNIDSIDILKIDTQSYEDKILEGATESLKRGIVKTIELELILADDIYNKKLTFYDIEKFLIPNNYHFYGIDKIINKYDNNILSFNVIYTQVQI